MADIAILVAEEYERRIKNSRKGGGEKAVGLEINWVSSFSDVAQRVKNLVGQQHNHVEIVKSVLEPKTQIGLAASTGFFSA